MGCVARMRADSQVAQIAGATKCVDKEDAKVCVVQLMQNRLP